MEVILPTSVFFRASTNNVGKSEAFFQPRFPPSRAFGVSENAAET